MLSRCSIWNKLLLGVAMLALMVATLSASSILGVSSYRRLVRSVSQRAAELPLADKLVRSVSELRITFAQTRQWRDQGSSTGYKPLTIREDFRIRIFQVNEALKQYARQLDTFEPDVSAIGATCTSRRPRGDGVTK